MKKPAGFTAPRCWSVHEADHLALMNAAYVVCGFNVLTRYPPHLFGCWPVHEAHHLDLT